MKTLTLLYETVAFVVGFVFVVEKVLISCRNNKKLLGRVKAFDRHMNMVRTISFPQKE